MTVRFIWVMGVSRFIPNLDAELGFAETQEVVV